MSKRWCYMRLCYLQPLLPTYDYDTLLELAIGKIKVALNPIPKLVDASYDFPDNITYNPRLVIFFKLEVLNKMGVLAWPFTRENESIKTRLARDIILWHKKERPDVLYVLKDLLF